VEWREWKGVEVSEREWNLVKESGIEWTIDMSGRGRNWRGEEEIWKKKGEEAGRIGKRRETEQSIKYRFTIIFQIINQFTISFL
jgi:hypothetical protein